MPEGPIKPWTDQNRQGKGGHPRIYMDHRSPSEVQGAEVLENPPTLNHVDQRIVDEEGPTNNKGG